VPRKKLRIQSLKGGKQMSESAKNGETAAESAVTGLDIPATPAKAEPEASSEAPTVIETAPEAAMPEKPEANAQPSEVKTDTAQASGEAAEPAVAAVPEKKPETPAETKQEASAKPVVAEAAPAAIVPEKQPTPVLGKPAVVAVAPAVAVPEKKPEASVKPTAPIFARLVGAFRRYKLAAGILAALMLAVLVVVGYKLAHRQPKPDQPAQEATISAQLSKAETTKAEPKLAEVEGSFREYLAERDAKMKKVLEETKAQEDRQKAQEERFYGKSQ
jgi:hypothetical protein